ncbi:hypothetical protein BU15DRAFT_66585 [Melanogaster broomeanus]|nr:hypothetical protein BU15DRAFT_66585 [Melanogaster broomeanus]
MRYHDVTPQSEFRSLLALVWLRTGCDVGRMESNQPDNLSRFQELLEGILTDDVVQLLDDQQMAAPRRYFDPLRTGQSRPPCRSRALYMSDLKSLVIISRDACRVWIALELGLKCARSHSNGSRSSSNAFPSFGEHIVDLDLFPRTNKDDIHANTIWNPISVFEWFAFTCVYLLAKRGNHLIIT